MVLDLPEFAPIRKKFPTSPGSNIKPGDRVVVYKIWRYYGSLKQFLPYNTVFSPYQDEVIMFMNSSAFITTYEQALAYKNNWIEQTKNDILSAYGGTPFGPGNFVSDESLDMIILGWSPYISPVSLFQDGDKILSDEEILDQIRKLYCVVQKEPHPIDGTPSGTFLLCGKAEDHELAYLCKNIIGGLDAFDGYVDSKYVSAYSVDLLTDEEKKNQDECAACKRWAVVCGPVEEDWTPEPHLPIKTHVSLYSPYDLYNAIGVYKSFDDATKESNKCNNKIKWKYVPPIIGELSGKCVEISECCGQGYDTLFECECSSYDPPPEKCTCSWVCEGGLWTKTAGCDNCVDPNQTLPCDENNDGATTTTLCLDDDI